MNISSTHTKAVVQINQVLAPGAIIPHHRRKLADIQDGNSSFRAVVSISFLKTYVKPSTVQDQSVENVPKEFSECVLIKPPSDIPEIAVTAGESQTIGELLGIDSLSELEGKEEEEEEEEDFLYADDFEPEIPSNGVPNASQVPLNFIQGTSVQPASRILTDCLHSMMKINRTMSKKHSLFRAYRSACGHKCTTLIGKEEVLPKRKDNYALQQ
ncbi:hypothetical protein K435DRAFT_876104 [Dendrothele bispora CBS 962.96]|uniref:Uncharacterized protein n=1 Tax=Dendrothele bispora (strain CBS 962.96) TaxID=1314807 RepID=A0A4S8KT10_DENBC|nr:hypothetical protein K435DRAFT_876104 [Dendrothele bispora CBS 962.96]